MITPFDSGRVDRTALLAAVGRQLRAGMDAIVLCDLAGEGYALADDERDMIISTCVERAAGQLAVIVATGTNATAGSMAITRRAGQLGADGLIVTVPYYSKPTTAGVCAHFRSIAEITHLPIIIDDEPQRTVIEGGARLFSALADVPTIVGIRHGAGRLAAFTQLEPVLRRRYHHYCGDDTEMPGFLACGAHGAIFGLGNLWPFQMAALGRGLAGAAGQLQRQMTDLLGATDGHWDAAVIKEACATLHGSSAEVRLPMVEIDTDMRGALRRVLAGAEMADMPATA